MWQFCSFSYVYYTHIMHLYWPMVVVMLVGLWFMSVRCLERLDLCALGGKLCKCSVVGRLFLVVSS